MFQTILMVGRCLALTYCKVEPSLMLVEQSQLTDILAKQLFHFIILYGMFCLKEIIFWTFLALQVFEPAIILEMRKGMSWS